MPKFFCDTCEGYILRRLQREKRSGVITQVDAEHYRFSVDVYDARELLHITLKTGADKIFHKYTLQNPAFLAGFFSSQAE